MNIATYSIAVTGLILWGWYHFSVRWINEDLKKNIFTKFPKEEIIHKMKKMKKISSLKILEKIDGKQ